LANLKLALSLSGPMSKHLLKALHTLYLIPLEMTRLEAREDYAREHQRALEEFVKYQYTSQEEASR
jgi:hypothetical protein